MNLVTAIGLAAELLSGIIAMQEQLMKVSALIQQAQAQGRDLTDEELALLKAARNAARQAALGA